MPDSRHRVKGFACRLDDRAGGFGCDGGADVATEEVGEVADGRHHGMCVSAGNDTRSQAPAGDGCYTTGKGQRDGGGGV